jgi:HlyD family secretion protein
MKRVIWIVLVVLLVIGGIIFIRGKQKSSTQSSIQTTTVKREDFTKSVNSSGKTTAAKSVDLKFQTSGKLAWVGVKEGDTVAAYQAIASMDSREVQKNLEKALRSYSSERNDFEETWRVTYQGRSTPEQALNDTMKRILEKNQWDLEQAVLDVELKHLSVEYATLITPIAGIITHIDTPVAGINITPATAVFSVADPNSLTFEANVDEIDVGSLAVGQKATVSLDAFRDATFSGTISYVSYTSETSGGGATVFPVKIAFDEPQRLRIGLNGDVSIQVSNESQVLTVPIEAIREDDDGKYVYRKTGSNYERVGVVLGLQGENSVVVKEGLSDGDSIVTKGFTNIPKSK